VPTPSPAYARAIALGTPLQQAALTALADATIQTALDQAALYFTRWTAWAKYGDLVCLTALHMLAFGALAAVVPQGPVTSASAGGISQSAAVQAVAIQAGLDLRTPWGERAIRLLAGLPPPMRAARVGTGHRPY
jgi:hypothetical protein